jgi:hypothetical protein
MRRRLDGKSRNGGRSGYGYGERASGEGEGATRPKLEVEDNLDRGDAAVC